MDPESTYKLKHVIEFELTTSFNFKLNWQQNLELDLDPNLEFDFESYFNLDIIVHIKVNNDSKSISKLGSQ